jgi:hypothetical protein
LDKNRLDLFIEHQAFFTAFLHYKAKFSAAQET